MRVTTCATCSHCVRARPRLSAQQLLSATKQQRIPLWLLNSYNLRTLFLQLLGHPLLFVQPRPFRLGDSLAISSTVRVCCRGFSPHNPVVRTVAGLSFSFSSSITSHIRRNNGSARGVDHDIAVSFDIETTRSHTYQGQGHHADLRRQHSGMLAATCLNICFHVEDPY